MMTKKIIQPARADEDVEEDGVGEELQGCLLQFDAPRDRESRAEHPASIDSGRYRVSTSLWLVEDNQRVPKPGLRSVPTARFRHRTCL